MQSAHALQFLTTVCDSKLLLVIHEFAITVFGTNNEKFTPKVSNRGEILFGNSDKAVLSTSGSLISAIWNIHTEEQT